MSMNRVYCKNVEGMVVIVGEEFGLYRGIVKHGRIIKHQTTANENPKEVAVSLLGYLSQQDSVPVEKMVDIEIDLNLVGVKRKKALSRKNVH